MHTMHGGEADVRDTTAVARSLTFTMFKIQISRSMPWWYKSGQ